MCCDDLVLYIVPKMDQVYSFMVGRRQMVVSRRRLPLQVPNVACDVRQRLIAAAAALQAPVIRIALQHGEARLRSGGLVRERGARVVEVLERRRLDVDQGHDGIFPVFGGSRR